MSDTERSLALRHSPSTLPMHATTHPVWENSFPIVGGPQPEESSLAHYLWILKRNRWYILAFVAFCVALTAGVSLQLTPFYESTATVDIDLRAPTGVIGQDTSVGMAGSEAEGFLTTQIRLVQSDGVLRPVVKKLNLYPDVEDSERRNWSAAASDNDAPIVLKHLDVKRVPNTYLLSISYRSPNPQTAAAVANGVAQSYIDETYETRFRASARLASFMEKQLRELKGKMEASAAKLAPFEREVIDPEQKSNVLSARLMQLNTELTNVQVDKVQKEAALESANSGSLEATQSLPQGEQLRVLSSRLDEVKERFVQVRSQLGPNHPDHRKLVLQMEEIERQIVVLRTTVAKRVGIEFQQVKNKEQMLSVALAKTKAEFDSVNAQSFGVRALRQEAEADRSLYQELTRKIKEAGINANFQNSSVRLADVARPALNPSGPRVKLNVLLALFASTIFAFAGAILSDFMNKTLRDPDLIQSALKTQVLSALPAVKSWDGSPRSSKGSSGALVPIRPTPMAGGFYQEAVRILQNSIRTSIPHINGARSILITSAVPGEGKTTTSVHLAISHSQQKQRTLIIDADLRKPGIHRWLGTSNSVGLSNVVHEEIGWRDAVQTTPLFPYLSILPAGPASPNAVHRIGDVLADLLLETKDEYDLILIDSPPVLGFAEPLQIASLVGGVVLVALAGKTQTDAVANAVDRLKRVKSNVLGVALNKVEEDVSERYHYYSYGDYYGVQADAS